MFALLIPIGPLAGTSFSPETDPSASQVGDNGERGPSLFQWGHFLFELNVSGFTHLLDLATRWFVEMKAGPRLNSVTYQTLVWDRRHKSSHTTCSCQLRDMPALSWGTWISTCRRGLLQTGPTAFRRKIGPPPMARGWRTFWGGCKCWF